MHFFVILVGEYDHYCFAFISLHDYWYNKTCRLKQLTPNYICIKVNRNNPQCQKMKNAAIHYRINQELKFLYAKKKNK